jgi:hypothetical protein
MIDCLVWFLKSNNRNGMTEKKSSEEDVHTFKKKNISDVDKNESRSFEAKKKKGVRRKKKLTKKEMSDRTQEMSDQLQEIYKNDDGSLPDMQQFETKKRGRLPRAFGTLLAACLLLGAVAYYGFFVFVPSNSFSEADVIVTVSGEDTALIGQDVQYRVRYRNAQKIPLSQVSVHVRYPEGFVYKESSRPPDEGGHDSWTIGALDSHDSGFIDITGTLYGNVDQAQSVRVFFNYLPSNFSSEFQKVATKEIVTANSPVLLDVVDVGDVVAGAQHTLTIRVEKGEQFLQSNANTYALVIDTSDAFVIQESDHKADTFDSGTWTIPSFEEPFALQVKGVFVSEEQADIILPIRVLAWHEGQSQQDDPYEIAREELTVSVSQQDVRVSGVVNGSARELSVQPGELLNISVVAQNNTDKTISDVKLRAIFDAPSYRNRSILNWGEIDDPSDGDIIGEQLTDERRRGSITWTKRHAPGLRSIAPGESVVIDFQMRVKTSEQTDLTKYPDGPVTLATELQYDTGDQAALLSGLSINMTVLSDMTLEVREERESRGGSQIFDVAWVLTNTFHELEDIVLKATIYGDTQLDLREEDVPAGEVVYDEGEQKLTWRIERMPVDIDVLSLPFTLTQQSRDPTQSQLTSKVHVQAVDAVVQKDIIMFGPEIQLGE